MKGEWIEIKTRKPTEEEIQEYMNDPCPDYDIDDPEDLIFFDCQMPEDGQEVLITTSWGNVCIDTYVQEYGAFEDHEDHEDVVAWMPLPEPFKKEPEAAEAIKKALQEINDRPCEKCKHKVETKPGVEACYVWDCSFEPKRRTVVNGYCDICGKLIMNDASVAYLKNGKVVTVLCLECDEEQEKVKANEGKTNQQKHIDGRTSASGRAFD